MNIRRSREVMVFSAPTGVSRDQTRLTARPPAHQISALSLQRCYRDDLEAAGFDVFTTAVDYVASLDLDQLAGCLFVRACQVHTSRRASGTNGDGRRTR
jgi:hypothetical protein